MPKECVNTCIIHILLTYGFERLVFGIKLKVFYSERRIERLNGMQTKFKIQSSIIEDVSSFL
jgi:hypothetical protein